MTSIKILSPTAYFGPREVAEDPSAKMAEEEEDIKPDTTLVSETFAKYATNVPENFSFYSADVATFSEHYSPQVNIEISKTLGQSLLHQVERALARGFPPTHDIFEHEMKTYLAKINKFALFLNKLPRLSLRKINALIMIIVDMEWQYIGTGDCCVFGGFVRDLFDCDRENGKGREFNDIDLWVDHKDSDRAIRYSLEAAGYKTVSEVRLPKVAHYSLRADHYRLTVTSPGGYEFSFDVTKGGAFHELGIDFNCNSLYFSLLQEELEVRVRVYFPEYPIIALEDPRRGQNKNDREYKLVHIPEKRVLMFHQQQLDHDRAIDLFFDLGDRYLENPHNAKHSDLIGGLRDLNKRILRKNIPDVVEIVEEIEERRAARAVWCASMVNDKRIATMKEKGYTIVAASNSDPDSCVSLPTAAASQ